MRVRAGIRIQFLNRREVIEMNYAQHTPATFKQAAMQQIAQCFARYRATDNVQQTTCSRQRATDNVQQTTCDRQRATDNVQQTTAACNM